MRRCGADHFVLRVQRLFRLFVLGLHIDRFRAGQHFHELAAHDPRAADRHPFGLAIDIQVDDLARVLFGQRLDANLDQFFHEHQFIEVGLGERSGDRLDLDRLANDGLIQRRHVKDTGTLLADFHVGGMCDLLHVILLCGWVQHSPLLPRGCIESPYGYDVCGRDGRVKMLVCVAVMPVAFQLLDPKVHVPESVEPPLRMV